MSEHLVELFQSSPYQAGEMAAFFAGEEIIDAYPWDYPHKKGERVQLLNGNTLKCDACNEIEAAKFWLVMDDDPKTAAGILLRWGMESSNHKLAQLIIREFGFTKDELKKIRPRKKCGNPIDGHLPF